MTARISRRTVLRAAGASLALPALDMMLPRGSRAQAAPPKRFVGFFYPNGTDARIWNPEPGALAADALPQGLQDLAGFAAEGIWPAGGATFGDVTVVTGIDHSGVCFDIHMPSLALCAHRGAEEKYLPSEPTLDQFIAERVQGDSPYRVLSLSANFSNAPPRSSHIVRPWKRAPAIHSRGFPDQESKAMMPEKPGSQWNSFSGFSKETSLVIRGTLFPLTVPVCCT